MPSGDLDDLIRKLDKMNKNIDKDADKILKLNAQKFNADTKKSARAEMKKGYWTGNLARMVEDTKIGNLNYKITSNAHYSGFVEYGTRYMEPETFMFPVYEKYTKQVRSDLSRLIDIYMRSM
ncbi:HK97-gp10 family putative phage morphogenesis protein [Staphylococcus capitis]|uniref:HK97-gp10 family putative phage morphogenesis protein n=1 Tax=Staphylococcus capitis TaxID=29388 RepID=UPI002DBD4EFA|nr:HK97-gp10 family putative phage morphogenesis protein [Staphylococcus capitis]MEB5628927.1 HK97 gp10 family phage protein [Staphylococcus capitis]